MNGYFKPWRRKIGVLTLLMACVFMAAWVRGQDKINQVDLRIPVGEHVEYSIVLRPTVFQIYKYYSIQHGVGRATGAQSIAKMSYWRIAIPLTLLSAYLLLSKPRAPKQPLSSTGTTL